MYISKGFLSAALMMLLAATALAFAVGASGDRGHDREGGKSFFRSSLAPSMPTDPTLHGVAPGGLPWALERGSVRLQRQENGERSYQSARHDRGRRFRLEVERLVLKGQNSPGPVTTITAALFCGVDTAAAATTGSARLSRGGDARIDADVSLPSSCLAPVALVYPNGDKTHYIAVSGFRS